MDHKVLTYLLFVFLTTSLQNAKASKNGITLSVGEDNEHTATCSLSLDKFQAPTMKQIHCIKGKQGIPGMPGIPGATGETGEFGYPGVQGPRGNYGDPAISGTAPSGTKGKRGLPGPPGNKGKRGPKPECTPELCYEDKNIVSGFGTEDSPAQVTCKFAPPGTESGEYFMGPVSQSFKVHCAMDKNETCIKIISEYLFLHSGWSSNQNVRLVEKANLQNIRWLQERSSSARQTLEYGCNFNAHKNIRFLSWNDIMIAPNHLNESSLYFTLNPDGCLLADPYSDSNKIEIVSSKADSLPVTDVWFRKDDEDEEFIIADNEICFG